MATSQISAEFNSHITGVRAVLLGGLCAIGISCFCGSILAGIWLRLAMWNGASLHEAYAALMSSWGSPFSWLGLVPPAFATAIGGYIAARGGDKPVGYAVLSSFLYLSFVGSMYINPASQIAPFWYLLISLVIPVFSAALGGVLYARKP
jgi:hypothetical protein